MDFADAEGHTALHAACAFGSTDCVRMLIQAGASLNLPDCIQSHKLALATHRQSHPNGFCGPRLKCAPGGSGPLTKQARGYSHQCGHGAIRLPRGGVAVHSGSRRRFHTFGPRSRTDFEGATALDGARMAGSDSGEQF